MARGCCSAPVGLAFCSAQGHSGTRRALRVDEVTIDAGNPLCARRLTRRSSMTMPSASARASGFLAVVVSATARATALPTSRLSRPRLQRSPFAALGVCGGHPKTRRCGRPARWSTGRLRAVPVIETSMDPRLVITSQSISTSIRAYVPRRAVSIRSVNAGQRAWRLTFRQAAERRLTASRIDARLAALMPANPTRRSPAAGRERGGQLAGSGAGET